MANKDLSVGVNDVILRLQNVLAKDNEELKKCIGGAVDVKTILDDTSIAPMSFHVAYVGSTTPEEQVNAATRYVATKTFTIYVVLNVDKFNGRYPQACIPKIEEQLTYTLFGWEPNHCHHPFKYVGDSMEYLDRGRYIHAFTYSVDYEFNITWDEFGNSNIYVEGDVTPFDSLYTDWIIGKDEDGNETVSEFDIINIYNDGEPLI